MTIALRSSFREDIGRRIIYETLRAIEGKKPYETIEYLRAKVNEELVAIQLEHTSEETLRKTTPVVVDHTPKRRGYLVSDYDSAAASGKATQFQFKVIHECLNIPMDDLQSQFMKLGEERFYSVKMKTTLERKAENIPTMRRVLDRLRYAWQDFNSFVFHNRDKERLSMSVDVYGSEMVRHENRYLGNPRIIDLPARLACIGIESWISSQNQWIYVAPHMTTAGFKTTANHIPEIKNNKVFLPPSSIAPLNIISAADKHGLIKRLRSYLSRTFTRNEKADFFSDAESDTFFDHLNADYEMPVAGYQRTFLVESQGEFSGDVLETLSGMFKPSDFDVALLIDDKEGPFSKSGKLGKAAEEFLAKERTRIVNVNSEDEITNLIANMTVHHDQLTRSKGAWKTLEICRNPTGVPPHLVPHIDPHRIGDATREMSLAIEKWEKTIEEVELSTSSKIPREEI